MKFLLQVGLGIIVLACSLSFKNVPQHNKCFSNDAIDSEISAHADVLKNKDPFVETIRSRVLETIEHSDSVPGLQSDAFNSIKKGIEERWLELVEKGLLEISAEDSEVRPYFVALQGIVEHVLSHELGITIQSLMGVIHTPMPATPLCSLGEVSKELVDPSMEQDPLRLFTVKARTTILRDYLFQGGDLFIVYPKEGLNKRTEVQQHIYKNELNNYPKHLFDCPLDCESIPTELVGAFYIFSNFEGKSFVFAIKIGQANNPNEINSFGLWFDEVSAPSIHERVSKVMNYITQYSLGYFRMCE